MVNNIWAKNRSFSVAVNPVKDSGDIETEIVSLIEMQRIKYEENASELFSEVKPLQRNINSSALPVEKC